MNRSTKTRARICEGRHTVSLASIDAIIIISAQLHSSEDVDNDTFQRWQKFNQATDIALKSTSRESEVSILYEIKHTTYMYDATEIVPK